jgi:uncharacterized integral membrane protein
MRRFIGFIIILAVFIIFIGFNLENSCDISFGFRMISHVPVYLTVLVSFMLGLLCAIPFVWLIKIKKSRNSGGKIAPPKKSGKGKNSSDAGNSDGGTYGESGPYGIG